MFYYRLNVEDAEALVAFIKMHEREEIPEDVWEVCVDLQNFILDLVDEEWEEVRNEQNK